MIFDVHFNVYSLVCMFEKMFLLFSIEITIRMIL